VTLAATDNVGGSGLNKIVYTTDGSDPSLNNGADYTGAFSLASMRAIRPLAIVAVTTQAWARPGTLNSAAYLAAPVTFAGPSTRDVAVPM
jgi:hypothetical protein